jgi:hypothetical protein
MKSKDVLNGLLASLDGQELARIAASRTRDVIGRAICGETLNSHEADARQLGAHASVLEGKARSEYDEYLRLVKMTCAAQRFAVLSSPLVESAARRQETARLGRAGWEAVQVVCQMALTMIHLGRSRLECLITCLPDLALGDEVETAEILQALDTIRQFSAQHIETLKSSEECAYIEATALTREAISLAAEASTALGGAIDVLPESLRATLCAFEIERKAPDSPRDPSEGET